MFFGWYIFVIQEDDSDTCRLVAHRVRLSGRSCWQIQGHDSWQTQRTEKEAKCKIDVWIGKTLILDWTFCVNSNLLKVGLKTIVSVSNVVLIFFFILQRCFLNQNYKIITACKIKDGKINVILALL